MYPAISVLSKVTSIVPELQKRLSDIKIHRVENPETDEYFKNSEIIVSDFDLISPYIYDLPNVKWIQGTWAGIEVLLKVIKTEKPKYIITRFAGKHKLKLICEYVICHIVNYERSTFVLREYQLSNLWIREGKSVEYRSIADLTIGILGVGMIGNNMAKLLNSLGANILGYGRKSSFNLKENTHISQYYTKNSLPELLQSCDYFINVLPETKETIGLLNGNVLEICKNKKVVFINIGRGSIITEECLVTALKNKWLSGAILDVFESEPLSKDSLLWSMPNVIVTPHCSGICRGQDVAEQVMENLVYFKKKLPIPGTIDFVLGY